MECPTKVHVLEVLPPYLLPLWDTWTLGTKPLLSLQPDGTIVVEWTAKLAPETDFEVMLDYEPVLLPFQQFPGDPNRGIELPPTQFVFESECATGPVKLYSSPLLLMPPVQDMSMPFNVISLSCTLYAFIIGSLANLLVRKASEKVKQTLHPETKKSKLQKLKERLRNKLGLGRKSNSASEAQKGAGETSQASSSKDPGDKVAPNVTTEEVKVDASE
jgi:phosphatidylinositol glycan class T